MKIGAVLGMVAALVAGVVIGVLVFPEVADEMAAPGAAPAGDAVPSDGAVATAFDPMSVPAGTYALDQQHSSIVGKVQHAGLSYFTFVFKRFDAQFTYDPASPETSRVEVTIDPTSWDTNVPGFDINIATSDSRFNSPYFPEITYIADTLRLTGGNTGVMEGQMTFLGVTKPLHFDVILRGISEGRGGASLGFSATTSFNKSDFNFSVGSENLAEEVHIQVEADFQQQS
jgi:polyisoprenoid-binding protein YceI